MLLQAKAMVSPYKSDAGPVRCFRDDVVQMKLYEFARVELKVKQSLKGTLKIPRGIVDVSSP